MAKVGSKASTKAIEYCSKLSGKELPKSTTWATISDIILEGYVYDLHTQCKSMGDNTIIKLYKEPGEKEDIIETFTIPNSEVFIEKEGDWEWNYIWKMLAEYLMKKRKPKKRKPAKIDPAVLEADIARIREEIRTARGKDKKKLIQEYNDKSKVLAELKPAETPEPPKSEPDPAALKKQLNALYMKIRYEKKKGRDTSDLEAKYNELKSK